MKEAVSSEKTHTLSAVNREACELTGVTDVGLFHETMVSAATGRGEVTLTGQGLHVDELNLEKGILTVKGKIDSITYDERGAGKKGVLKRLFR